ncbi:hypothetical protein AAVH_33777 [Aphelenchoides avenae]|nr:hypothetical protein AAVH_33777 [Aphelenchus avenae]
MILPQAVLALVVLQAVFCEENNGASLESAEQPFVNKQKQGIAIPGFGNLGGVPGAAVLPGQQPLALASEPRLCQVYPASLRNLSCPACPDLAEQMEFFPDSVVFREQDNLALVLCLVAACLASTAASYLQQVLEVLEACSEFL